jgi:hypothetical protein
MAKGMRRVIKAFDRNSWLRYHGIMVFKPSNDSSNKTSNSKKMTDRIFMILLHKRSIYDAPWSASGAPSALPHSHRARQLFVEFKALRHLRPVDAVQQNVQHSDDQGAPIQLPLTASPGTEFRSRPHLRASTSGARPSNPMRMSQCVRSPATPAPRSGSASSRPRDVRQRRNQG